MAPDDEDAGGRQVLMGLGALVVVTLLVGGVVSAMALGAARLTGLGEASSTAPEAEPSLYFPSEEPTTSPEAYPVPEGEDRPAAGDSEPTPEPDVPSPTRRERRITLQAFPLTVSPGERINLTGVYPGGEGSTLQVQRFEGRWTDFPVDTTVTGGIYETFILTSRTGQARFRVLDTASGRASNPVRVTIR